ncbi:hypothetical protein D3C87_1601530 [compost metagenome]
MMRHASWSNGVVPHISVSLMFFSGKKVRAENGCVGDRRSPGAGLFVGTGFSGAGTTRLPSRRSIT